jgi:hypothetical protein
MRLMRHVAWIIHLEIRMCIFSLRVWKKMQFKVYVIGNVTLNFTYINTLRSCHNFAWNGIVGIVSQDEYELILRLRISISEEVLNTVPMWPCLI